MAAFAEFHARLARLSLSARLRTAISVLAIPLIVSAVLAFAAHLVAVAAWQDLADREFRAVELVARSAALLPGVEGDKAARHAALTGLRANMRDIVALSDSAGVRKAAQDLSLLTYQYEVAKAGATPTTPAPLAPLLDKLVASAAAAAAEERGHAASLGYGMLALMVLFPALAAVGGVVLARGITRNIDGTLRDCIAFASDIAAGNFRHGGAHARPGARARHMAASADSASEFDVLVRAMNRIASETVTAAEREVEQSARLEQVDRSWRLLSSCSQSLVKASSETALLDAICGYLVELGGYRIAWVGYARDDEGQSIEPVSHAGTDRDYLHALHLSWGNDVHKQGGFGTAVHQRRVMVCKRLAGDLVFSSWRAVSLPHGLEAAVALPLMESGEAIGVLGVYTNDAKVLTDDELKLLQDLCEDLVFGIVSRRQGAQREKAEEQLAHHVNFDGLTGLANLATLDERLAHLLPAAKAQHKKVAALHVDLDRFKDINDTLGRAVGDKLLVQVAQRLTHAAGSHSLVARLGGDEFVVVLAGVAGSGNAAEAATRIVAALAEPLPRAVYGAAADIKPVVSVGISLFPDDAADAAALLRTSDLAMQDAKRQGGNACRFYAKEMNARMAARYVMETELSRALEREEMVMHYQPQCSLVTGAIIGAEALMRWNHPTRGVVAPMEFIRVAEETGLMLPIGEWAIETVCAQLRHWREAGHQVPPVSINFSARQFHQKDLTETVRDALERNHVPAKGLEVEITESAVMRDVETAIVTLRQLKELGVRIALDDFGTGYSSLNYLKRFPIDHLKIDQSFVRGIVSTPDDATICNAIIALAHNLHIGAIAEGVETEEQMSYLRRHHCDSMQGFLFSRAITADAYMELLASGRKLPLLDHGEPQRTLLLLDDEPNIVRALNRALRQDGYKILAATSAADALKLLALNPVQVVMSDQRMPEMTGTEFLSRVKDLYPDTVRIILSGYADLESVIDAINRGTVYRFFTKPWNDDELRACVTEAFRHDPGVRPASLHP